MNKQLKILTGTLTILLATAILFDDIYALKKKKTKQDRQATSIVSKMDRQDSSSTRTLNSMSMEERTQQREAKAHLITDIKTRLNSGNLNSGSYSSSSTTTSGANYSGSSTYSPYSSSSYSSYSQSSSSYGGSSSTASSSSDGYSTSGGSVSKEKIKDIVRKNLPKVSEANLDNIAQQIMNNLKPINESELIAAIKTALGTNAISINSADVKFINRLTENIAAAIRGETVVPMDKISSSSSSYSSSTSASTSSSPSTSTSSSSYSSESSSASNDDSPSSSSSSKSATLEVEPTEEEIRNNLERYVKDFNQSNQKAQDAAKLAQNIVIELCRIKTIKEGNEAEEGHSERLDKLLKEIVGQIKLKKLTSQQLSANFDSISKLKKRDNINEGRGEDEKIACAPKTVDYIIGQISEYFANKALEQLEKEKEAQRRASPGRASSSTPASATSSSSEDLDSSDLGYEFGADWSDIEDDL